MALVGRLQRRFPALGRTDFRLYWAGMFSYSFQMQARTVIIGWLVYQLTGSALSLGAYIGTWGISALLFSFVGGTFSDRHGPKRVVVVFRMLASLSLFGVFLLQFSGQLVFWHLLVVSFINGTVSSFEYPARSALLAGIIPHNELTGGFGLMYSAMNLASILGPATMGWATEALGPRWALLVTSLIGFTSALVMAPIQVPDEPSTALRRGSLLGDVANGVRYLSRERRLLIMESLLLVYVIAVVPYRDIMPAVAADVLKVGASGLGLLSSAVSIGAFLGTLLLSIAGELRPRGTILILAAMVEVIGVLFYSQSTVLWLSVMILAVTGVGRGFFIPINNALLQAYAAPDMRARVVGMNMTVWALQPIGTIIVGAVADQIGPGSAVLISAAMGLGAFLLYFFFSPYLRTLE